MGITSTTEKVEHDTSSNKARKPNKGMEDDREFMIDHVSRLVDKSTNIRSVIRRYGYTSGDDTMEPRANIPTAFIEKYWQKILQAKSVRQQT